MSVAGRFLRSPEGAGRRVASCSFSRAGACRPCAVPARSAVDRRPGAAAAVSGLVAAARHRPRSAATCWPASCMARAPRWPSACGGGRRDRGRRRRRHAGRLRRRHRRRGADAHHRRVPDRARLPAGAGLRQRGRRPRSAWWCSPSRSAHGPDRPASRAPKCCRSASATMLPARASSACTRWRSPSARSCPTRLPPVLALSSVIVAGAILTEAALSFLGLGRSEPRHLGRHDRRRPRRAALRAVALDHSRASRWCSTVLGVYLAGEGARRGGAAQAEAVMSPRLVDPRPLGRAMRATARLAALDGIRSRHRRGRASGGHRRKRFRQEHAGAGDRRPAAGLGAGRAARSNGPRLAVRPAAAATSALSSRTPPPASIRC